jgi:hypothetical protein
LELEDYFQKNNYCEAHRILTENWMIIILIPFFGIKARE